MNKFIRLSLVLILTYTSSFAQNYSYLDTTFGNNGIVQTERTDNAEIQAMALQPDGKIIAAGWDYNFNPNYHFHSIVARYNSDGSLDTTFGNQGFTELSNGVDNQISCVKLLPNGKILVGANTTYEGWILFRLNADGSLDSSFADSGTLSSPFDTTVSGNVMSLLVRSDSSFVVGTIGAGHNHLTQFLLMGFKYNGATDSAFGNNGLVRSTMEAGKICEIFMLASDSMGRILASGVSGTPPLSNYPSSIGDAKIALARYLSNGIPDSSFGTDGHVLVRLDTATHTDIGKYVCVQPDGKIVVAAKTAYYGNRLSLLRFLPNGAPDATFGNNGAITFGQGYTLTGLGLLPDGKIVVGSMNNFSVSLHASNGVPILNFGDSGTVSENIIDGANYGNCLIVQPDGKVIVGGLTDSNNKSIYTLLRYNTDNITGITTPNAKKVLLEVYPNPIGNFIRVKGELSSIRQIQLINITGQVVKRFTNHFAGLLVSELPSGLYFLKIQLKDDNSEVFKVVKK